MKTVVDPIKSAAASRAWRNWTKDAVRVFFDELEKLATKPQERAWVTFGKRYTEEAFRRMGLNEHH